MRFIDWLDEMLPGSAIQTTASHTDSIRKRDRLVYKLTTAVDTGIISKEQARRDMLDDIDSIGKLAAFGPAHQERGQKDKCLWCTTPYEDDSGSCTKCGAPKDIKEVEAVALMMCSTSLPPMTWRI